MMAVTSDGHAARLVFRSASVRIADSARMVNSYPWRYVRVQIVQFGRLGRVMIIADRRVVGGHPSRGQCRRPVWEAIPTGQVQQGETSRMSEDLEDSLQDRATS